MIKESRCPVHQLYLPQDKVRVILSVLAGEVTARLLGGPAAGLSRRR